MAQQVVNLGSGPDTAGADSHYTAHTKHNANAAELYSAVALKQDGDATLTALSGLSGAGVVTATATDAFAMRAIGTSSSTDIPDRAAADTRYAAASHTHTASAISDFTEAAQDVIGAMVTAAGGSYNDGAGTITLPAGGGSSTLGLPYIDVKTLYNAYFDGSSHPLSGRYGSLGAAQAAYPNAGIVSLAEEIDAAALAQAAYDASYGNGGILGLLPGASVRLNRQVLIPNAQKCWLWGGANVSILTEGAGTTAAIKFVGAETHENILADVAFHGFNAGHTYVPQNLGGVAHTAFGAGSSAIEVAGCARFKIERVRFYNYDSPIRFSGSDNYIFTLRDCILRDNNYGFRIPVALDNSYEAVRLVDCVISNNNYGVWINSCFADGYPAGASYFIESSSLDYNVVQHVYFDGLGTTAPELSNTLILRGNHIESTSTCSGTAARGWARGTMHLVGNNIYEGGDTPAGMFELYHDESTNTVSRASASNNHVVHGNQLPIYYNSGVVHLLVGGAGNTRFYPERTLLARTGAGDVYDSLDWARAVDTTNTVTSSYTLALSDMGGTVEMNSASATTITIPPNSAVAFPIGATIKLVNINTGVPTVTAGSGVTIVNPFPSLALRARYSSAYVQKRNTNAWVVSGDLDLGIGMATLTDGATITWATAGSPDPNAKVTIAGNRTLAITGAVNGQRGTLIVTQDGTGGHTLTLPANSKKSGTPTTTGNAVNRYDYVTDGTNYWWTITPNLT